MHDDELDQKLENIEKLVEENHKMVRSLYVRARINSGLRIFYWLIIIGFAISSYYYVQPYLEQFRESYRVVTEAADRLRVPSIKGAAESILDKFKDSTSTPR